MLKNILTGASRQCKMVLVVEGFMLSILFSEPHNLFKDIFKPQINKSLFLFSLGHSFLQSLNDPKQMSV